MAWRNFNGKSGGHKGDKNAGKGSGKWHYWHGSWSPSSAGGAPWKKGQGKGQDSRSSLSFPGYDSATKNEQHIAEIVTLKDKESDSYATALQRAINQVRKAESRTRKALADKRARTAQWNNWVSELKKTFAKEKGRYQAAVSRLEREMEEAVLEQEGARAALRRVAASMEVDSSSGTTEFADVNTEFDVIIQEGPGAEEPAESNEDILRRTLDRCHVRTEGRDNSPWDSQVVTTPPSKRPPAYSLETSTPLRAPPAPLSKETQPPHTGAASASPAYTPAGVDPYMASPTVASRRSSPGTSGRKKVATPDGSGREGVKAAMRPAAPLHVAPASQTLADKLAARRLALARAGVAAQPLDAPGQNMGGVPAVDPAQPGATGKVAPADHPQQHILYDDEEDREPSEPSDLELWYNSRFGDLQTLE